MPSHRSRLIVVSAGLVATSLLAAVQANAELITLSACTPSIRIGTVLQGGATLDIPAGTSCRVMLPSGRTIELKGPLKSRVAELAKGETRNEALWNDVVTVMARQRRRAEPIGGATRSVAPRTRGTGEATAPPATTPPAAATAVPARPSFSWRHVPIDTAGDVCVEKGAALELLRARAGRPAVVAIVDRQNSRRGETAFDTDDLTAPWPTGVGTDVGLYSMSTPEGTSRTLRLRPISPLPEADETLRVLHGQRCLPQIEAWLAGIATAQR